MDCGSRTCKPNSVRNIAVAGRSFLWAGHYCPAQATYPKVVTHRASTFPPSLAAAAESLPIWSCTVWGLPCPQHYCCGGALLPHLFTLTPASLSMLEPYGTQHSQRRLGGIFSVALSVEESPTLAKSRQKWATPLPDVIRHTALRSSDFPPVLRRATARSSCQQVNYM
jgi:hypothetical protein